MEGGDSIGVVGSSDIPAQWPNMAGETGFFAPQPMTEHKAASRERELDGGDSIGVVESGEINLARGRLAGLSL